MTRYIITTILLLYVTTLHAQNRIQKSDFKLDFQFLNQTIFDNFRNDNFITNSQLRIKLPVINVLPIDACITYSTVFLPNYSSTFKGISLGIDLESCRENLYKLRSKYNQKLAINSLPQPNINQLNYQRILDSLQNKQNQINIKDSIPDSLNLKPDTLINAGNQLKEVDLTDSINLKKPIPKLNTEIKTGDFKINHDSLSTMLNKKRWFETGIFENLQFIKIGTLQPSCQSMIYNNLRLNGISAATNLPGHIYFEIGSGKPNIPLPFDITQIDQNYPTLPKYDLNTTFITTGIGSNKDKTFIHLNYLNSDAKDSLSDKAFINKKGELYSLNCKLNFKNGTHEILGEISQFKETTNPNFINNNNLGEAFSYNLHLQSGNLLSVSGTTYGKNYKSLSDPFLIGGSSTLAINGIYNLKTFSIFPTFLYCINNVNDNKYLSTNYIVGYLYQPAISFKILGDVSFLHTELKNIQLDQLGGSIGTEIYRKFKEGLVKNKIVLKLTNKKNISKEFRTEAYDIWIKINQSYQNKQLKLEGEMDLQYLIANSLIPTQSKFQILLGTQNKRANINIVYGIYRFSPYQNYSMTSSLQTSIVISKSCLFSIQYFTQGNSISLKKNNRIQTDLTYNF